MTNATQTETLTAGTRIYYTGDMANLSGEGVVSKVIADRSGAFYDITLDDGRVFRFVMHVAFAARPGCRWQVRAGKAVA